jgi:pimeloyl-ACP methyl ester carboxylesterase
MSGTKAQRLAQWASEQRRAALAFDYFGHGRSQGDFAAGTIGRWRADGLAMIDHLSEGPQILVGSSMGGWLACLLALARPERVAGLVLIAPAADFTEALIRPALPREALAALAQSGIWRRPSAYDAKGDPITARLLDEGQAWSILPGPVAITVPVRILQGGADPDVPWRHALDLATALAGPDVVFTLIRDGDHRLSRPQDLSRMIAMVEDICALSAA